MFGFSEWPKAAKWIVICSTALALLGTVLSAFFGYKHLIEDVTTMRLQNKALIEVAKRQAESVEHRNQIDAKMSRLPMDRAAECAIQGFPNPCCEPAPASGADLCVPHDAKPAEKKR